MTIIQPMWALPTWENTSTKECYRDWSEIEAEKEKEI
jgi:hypothetical protein